MAQVCHRSISVLVHHVFVSQPLGAESVNEGLRHVKFQTSQHFSNVVIPIARNALIEFFVEPTTKVVEIISF
jgi:hypothetical protein